MTGGDHDGDAHDQHKIFERASISSARAKNPLAAHDPTTIRLARAAIAAARVRA
jgi:hypothetical protein